MNSPIFEFLKKLHKDVDLPDIDLKSKVMQSIHKRKRKQQKFWFKNKVVLATSILICLLITGFIYIKTYQLFNNKGEVIFEYSELTDLPLKILSKEADRISPELEEGTAAVIFYKSKDGLISGQGIQKPISYKSISELQKDFGEYPVLLQELADDFKFTKGRIWHKIGDPTANKRSIYMPIEKIVVYRNVELLPEITSIDLVYQNSDKKVRLDISLENKDTVKLLSSDYDKNKLNKTILNGIEVLLVDKVEYGKLIWVEELGEHKVRYMLTAVENIRVNEMISLAESLILNR